MTPETKQAIIDHGLDVFPQEACGLVVVVKGKERYVPCRNIATNPEMDFVLDPRDYAAAADVGDIVAVAHTHPNATARASDADRAACEESGLPWFILSIVQDVDSEPEVREWNRIDPEGYVAPLVGRKFVHGIHDCYTIIRDWYKQERGVVLPNFNREDEWWNNGGNLYVENFPRAGFKEVPFAPQVGDVILMNIRADVPNHAAVYLGDGIILHHMYGRLSTRDVYGGYWAEVATKLLRYEGATDDKT